jgi:ribosome-associated protein
MMSDEKLDAFIPDRSVGGGEAARAFAIEAAQVLHDDKCEEIVVLDVRQLSRITDFIVIGSGTSQRQMGSALDHVSDLGRERGFERHRTNRDDQSLWLLADFVDVVVHLFEPNTRAHYDLEMLWGDAPRVEWAPRKRSTT